MDSFECIERHTQTLTQESMFEYIIESISNLYLQRGTLNTFFKITKKSKTLLIHLTYIKNTEYNPFSYDLKFRIDLFKTYPFSAPEVYCMSTFCFPSLFDHRNILTSILERNWCNPGLNKCSDPIEEIVIEIPNFVKKIKENSENKILIYHGIYNIDRLYDLNDFLMNPNLILYTIKTFSNKDPSMTKNRYLILTEIYALFFDIVNEDKKNMGKLIFWGDLRQISKLKEINEKDTNNNTVTEKICIEWKNEHKKIGFTFVFNCKVKRSIFIQTIKDKNSLLKLKFKLFQDDIAKPVKYNELVAHQPSSISAIKNLRKLKALAKYEEKILETYKSINIIKDLTLVYQRIIEILSVGNKNDFKEYMDKLKFLLSDTSIQEELKKNDIKTQNENIFESTNKEIIDCPFD